jgi:hypothetical protein
MGSEFAANAKMAVIAREHRRERVEAVSTAAPCGGTKTEHRPKLVQDLVFVGAVRCRASNIDVPRDVE